MYVINNYQGDTLWLKEITTNTTHNGLGCEQ